MKKYILLFTAALFIISCSTSLSDQAKKSVKAYLEKNLKNPATYSAVSFGEPVALSAQDTLAGKGSKYRMEHAYTVNNSRNNKANVSAVFYLDEKLNVVNTNAESIDGESGIMKGQITRKFKEPGSAPDVGTDVLLFAYGNGKGELKYSTKADANGNYKIDDIAPGKYFIVVRSSNIIQCPEVNIKKMIIFSEMLDTTFGLDLSQYKVSLDEMLVTDSAYNAEVMSNDLLKYGSLAKKIEVFKALKKKLSAQANNFLESLPSDFKNKIRLSVTDSKSYIFSAIAIKPSKEENENYDFGASCNYPE